MKKIILVLAVSSLSCQGKTQYKELKYHEQEMPAPASDVKLPTKLWNLFEDPTSSRGESASQKPTEFVGLKVFLYERNKGMLGGENHLLAYPAGGGELDYRDFVSEKNGSFYFAAEPRVKIENQSFRVYFLSNSVSTGCDEYYDVSTAFAKAMAGEGFLLNTTAQRHVGATAGTFFFVIDDGHKLQLARLTLKDSRYPQVHCKR